MEGRSGYSDALTNASRLSTARRRSSPGVHPHEPLPAAAARTREHVHGEQSVLGYRLRHAGWAS